MSLQSLILLLLAIVLVQGLLLVQLAFASNDEESGESEQALVDGIGKAPPAISAKTRASKPKSAETVNKAEPPSEEETPESAAEMRAIDLDLENIEEAARRKERREDVQVEWKDSPCEDTEWDFDGVQLHILAWKRPQSLYVLVQQLKDANYSNWGKDVPLYLHVDGAADPLVIQVVWSISWPHGTFHSDIREKNVGLREMWLSSMRTAARRAGPNTLMIVLEDDMRVSSIYFQWVMLMVQSYARNRRCRHDNLMGFSLSSVRLMEMRKPFKRWRAKEEFPMNMRNNSAYLSTLPSSWGGSFFTDRWLEFDAFVTNRMQPAYYDIPAEIHARTVASFKQLDLTPTALQIPGARSNWWPGSWKRFMIDFMYGCGFFMLYPMLTGENALATTLSLTGKHSLAKDKHGNREDDLLAADSQIRAPRKTDWQQKPQIAPLIKSDMAMIKDLILPDLASLQMTTLWMEPSTIDEAVRTGSDFVQTIIANENFTELGHAWCASARTINVLSDADEGGTDQPQDANWTAEPYQFV